MRRLYTYFSGLSLNKSKKDFGGIIGLNGFLRFFCSNFRCFFWFTRAKICETEKTFRFVDEEAVEELRVPALFFCEEDGVF
jgi:hypothetical protein